MPKQLVRWLCLSFVAVTVSTFIIQMQATTTHASIPIQHVTHYNCVITKALRINGDQESYERLAFKNFHLEKLSFQVYNDYGQSEEFIKLEDSQYTYAWISRLGYKIVLLPNNSLTWLAPYKKQGKVKSYPAPIDCDPLPNQLLKSPSLRVEGAPSTLEAAFSDQQDELARQGLFPEETDDEWYSLLPPSDETFTNNDE